MKKLFFCLFVLIFALPAFLLPLKTEAADLVVDKEFLPGFNVYGRYNSVFISSCTRFAPGKSSYASYFDLAVKNDQGAAYPMRASIRGAASSTVPAAATLKSYVQTTFNNYAMPGNSLSRFSATDGAGLTLTVGAYYFVCIDDLANNNATGWFYTASVSGGYSRQGYPGDVQSTFDGSFGYRMYAYTSPTPGGSNSNSSSGGSKTTSSNVALGGAPGTNISKSIVAPSNLAALYAADKKAVDLAWTASTTTTIGGYNIYRSETTGSGYLKVGETDKATTIFSDPEVTLGKTYYYMVRAFKSGAESVDSNEAKVTAAVAENTNVNSASGATATKTLTPWYKKPLFWIIFALVLILLGLAIFLFIRHRKKQKQAKQTNLPVNK